MSGVLLSSGPVIGFPVREWRMSLERWRTMLYDTTDVNLLSPCRSMSKQNPLLALFCAALILSISPGSNADLSVAVTIRPLQFIALAILGENASVSTLIDANSSPHDFSLSPSDRVSLGESDLIVWIGEGLESHLSDTMATLGAETHVITSVEISGLVLHSIGSNQQLDAHIWLDTRNSQSIAEQIALYAIEKDPKHSDTYRTNLESFSRDLMQVAEKLNVQFTELPSNTFAVYHNAFQYFEKQYQLIHQAELIKDPEISPSIGHIVATRNALQELRPRCLLVEPSANPELIRTIMGEYRNNNDVNEATVDLLGSEIEPSSSAYIELITNVANTFSSCLGVSTNIENNNRI